MYCVVVLSKKSIYPDTNQSEITLEGQLCSGVKTSRPVIWYFASFIYPRDILSIAHYMTTFKDCKGLHVAPKVLHLSQSSSGQKVETDV